MPELPEVETVRRGLEPLVKGLRIERLLVRRTDLRWPLPEKALQRALPGRTIDAIDRRAKYLLFRIDDGTLLVHLGMSGVLTHLPPERLAGAAVGRHDHLDVVLETGGGLRYTDPRRFGAVLWWRGPLAEHPLLNGLGPEPLSSAFSGDWLYERSRGRRLAVKNLIMDGRVVVGIGNIYAAEALFRARLHPARAAGTIPLAAWRRLAAAIGDTLQRAIDSGGTTLKDFRRGDGRPGYFQRSLAVYGREGQPCRRCGTRLLGLRLGGRSTCHCPACQPEED